MDTSGATSASSDHETGRLAPAEVGLPDFGGRRRVPGLRREEVALMAGMSVEYYERLERGNATGVSGNRARGISRALQPRGRITPTSTTRCARRTKASRAQRRRAHPAQQSQPGRAAAPRRDEGRPRVRAERTAGGHRDRTRSARRCSPRCTCNRRAPANFGTIRLPRPARSHGVPRVERLRRADRRPPPRGVGAHTLRCRLSAS